MQIIVKKQLVGKKERKEKEKRKKETQQHGLGTNVRVHGFKAGLLARSQFASGRYCDGPTRSRFSWVPEQMLSWHPNSTLHYMLPMQLS
jgi:hypothetical protein